MTVHASCVAIEGQAVVILGKSGSGKSSLALQLMAHGASLVADDRTQLVHTEQGLRASCPNEIRGLIEARGVGLLHADQVPRATVQLAVDLDQLETERFPQPRELEICGHRLICLHRVDAPHFAASILQMLKAGRKDP
jgi:HPr kinase/phosphorylase